MGRLHYIILYTNTYRYTNTYNIYTNTYRYTKAYRYYTDRLHKYINTPNKRL